MTNKLTFSIGNTKLLELQAYKGCKVTSFDLPAGHACPAANECHSFADKVTGKITDVANCKFRCYASSMEARYSASRKAHWRNYEAIVGCKTSDDIAKLILSELPADVNIVRIHASGDFFMKKGIVFETMRRLAKQLESEGIAYAIIGGMALAAHRLRHARRDSCL